MTWKDICDDDLSAMWKHMKDAFGLVEENKEYAMKQLQKQFRNKHHHLYKAYLQKKGRPHDVPPEDWNWLIHNKWNDSKLKERRLKNTASRSKKEIKSVIETKSIIQKAYEMKEELGSDEWPSAIDVWKDTRMRVDGTWCIPNGEEIMDNLKNVGEVYGEEIEKAHIPIIKHFQFVLGTKPSHFQGIGNISLAKRNVEKQLFQSQIHNAQKRAQDLELEVLKLSNIIQKQQETNMQL
ncbi:putative transposase [Vigna unguiculata]|uniref:Putative transposase n=1 Tax=Vigna unguiculata TaxID=3917 RepID=A0A4D6M796_VIGUN|nr:putative transposase [Vigna unguiculata]